MNFGRTSGWQGWVPTTARDAVALIGVAARGRPLFLAGRSECSLDTARSVGNDGERLGSE